MLCPFCGSMLTLPPPMNSQSATNLQLHNTLERRCLCRMTDKEVEQEHEKQNENLLLFAEQAFHVSNIDKLFFFIRNLERGHPARAEAMERWKYVERLREEMKKRRGKHPAAYSPNEPEKQKHYETFLEQSSVQQVLQQKDPASTPEESKPVKNLKVPTQGLNQWLASGSNATQLPSHKKKKAR